MATRTRTSPPIAAAKERAVAPPAAAAVDTVDTSYLETLVGYNARRAALSVIGLFLQRMAVYGLRPVDFSVLSLITHNPGITSSQLCSALSILPPNLVGMVNALARRGLIQRLPHPRDGRALGLHHTAEGQALMRLPATRDRGGPATPGQGGAARQAMKLVAARNLRYSRTA